MTLSSSTLGAATPAMSSSSSGVAFKQQVQGEVLRIIFDLPGEKVNKFNTATMTELRALLQTLQKSSYKLVQFESAKSKIYIAGADIDEIRAFTEKSQFDHAVEQGQDIFNLLEDLPMPTLAVIHGACVGGGCEFVMACDYRICSDDSSTRIGLPEVNLGIIPGFGGCVRMPRILGLAGSLDIILAGKTIAGPKAAKMGLVDRCVHPSLLPEQASKYAEEILKSGAKKRRKQFQPKGLMGKLMESFVLKPVVFSKAKSAVLSKSHGHYPAPLKALEVIQKTYGSSDRKKSLLIEREAFCEVAVTSISKNLIHVFDLMEMVKKQSGVSSSVKPKEVKSLGILGAGTMGGGIAFVAADKGVAVRMKDIQWGAIGKGLKHARDLWQKKVKKKSITEYDLTQKMSLVTGTVDFSGFKTLDVVVEAIVEDMEVKKKVIAQTAQEMASTSIIATNTSSLSVTEMGQAHPHPEYFCGMHFFNPVHKMPLVEVIRSDKSSDETIATIFELSKRMGKMPVVVKDGPGFLVNRLLLPYMAEAAFLLQEGQSIENVDTAFVKKFGMPMGPFALMDEVGLDVCMKVLKIFKKAFGERIEIAEFMHKLEGCGRAGKKNNKGFYHYDEKGYRGEVDNSVYADLGLSSPSNPLTEQECLERGIFAMINECALALKVDHIVATPHEVDLAMIMGTGFPPFRGGLLKYADSLGSKYIVEQLEKYSGGATARRRLKPTQPLVEMAKSQTKFYS